MLKEQPELAEHLLAQMESDLEATLNDVCRIVYELRPPELDQLGLVGAIQEFASQYGGNGLHIEVQIVDDLPALPTAVEVAAYRIAQEGLTNAMCHSQASHCELRLAVETSSDGNGRLTLGIYDDGIGLPQILRAGIGFTSMRERTEELGGRFQLESSSQTGTRITAVLPILPSK